MTTNAPDERLDPAVIELLREMEDEDFSLTELRELFAATALETIEELQGAVDKADGPTVRALAHRLKGSGGSMGARRVAFMCRELENLADGKLDRSAAAMTLEQLRAEVHAVLSALAEALP